MPARLLVALLVLVLAFFALRWFARAPAPQVARTLRRAALYGAAGLLVVLVLTGRLHWLFAAVGALLPFLGKLLALVRYVPVLNRLRAYYRAAHGAAQVQTRYLRMTLDRASGRIDGIVLEGRYQGARLSELAIEDLLALLVECRARDPEAAQLVQAFLDHAHGTAWRERTGAGSAGGGDTAPGGGRMSRAEACEILGVAPGADRDEIIAAHRRLIQRLHPDRGGSTYLAAKINQAKEVLLG